MRILFLLNIGFDRGGPSVHLLQDVIGSVLAKGYYADVILKDEGGNLEKFPQEFYENDKFTYTLIKDDNTKKKGFIARYLDEIKYARKCKKIYKTKKYDVVFLQSCNAALFYIKGLKKLKCPIVYNVQDIFPQNLMFSNQLPFSKVSYPILRRLQNAAYKKSAKIITISHDMKQTLVDQGVAEEKIEVIYNWSYGDSPISKDSIPEDNYFDLNMDHNKTNVVYAGNIGKMQNVELIAKAAVLSKNDNRIHYYIIGDGANKERVVSIVDGLNNVTVLPMQNSKYAESIYAQADVNLIPLIKSGIKTALPSKTATVLRTNSYVLFCIDKNSEFEKMVAKNSKIKIVDNTDPKMLYDEICKIHSEKMDSNVNCEDLSIFSNKNADAYREILTNLR